MAKNKHEQEYQSEHVTDVFTFAFNPKSEQHMKFVNFVARQAKKLDLHPASTDQKTAKMAGGRHIEPEENENREEKNDSNDDDKEKSDKKDSGFILEE